MQSRYKAVLFDLDGTLLDTIEDLGAAVNHALSLRGFSLHDTQQYRAMVGHGVRNLVMQALPEKFQADDSLIDSALADFKAYYTTHIDDHTRPYPGMSDLLRDLHAAGVALAVASNKFQSGTDRLIHTFFGDLPFVAVLGNREGFPLKPDPEIVGEVLRKAAVGPEEAVMVGDSGTDMRTARNGGIAAIAVGWGYRPMGPAEDYRYAACPDELRAMLLF